VFLAVAIVLKSSIIAKSDKCRLRTMIGGTKLFN
jgi:hypothetical protein